MKLVGAELKELLHQKLNEINEIKAEFNLTSIKLVDNTNNKLKVYWFYPLVFLVAREKPLSIITAGVIAQDLTRALRIFVGVYSDKILKSYIGYNISQKDYDLTIAHSIELEQYLQVDKAESLSPPRIS